MTHHIKKKLFLDLLLSNLDVFPFICTATNLLETQEKYLILNT
jgi:hypothetical protein